MKNENGFTLLEVLIATLIFVFGILVVGNMQITSIQGNSFANSLTEASTVAQDQIETLLNSSYSSTALSDTDSDGTNQDTDGDGIDDQGTDRQFGLNDNTTLTADHYTVNGRYTIYWNVAVDHPVSGTKTIRLIVTWNERGNQKQVVFDIVKPNV